MQKWVSSAGLRWDDMAAVTAVAEYGCSAEYLQDMAKRVEVGGLKRFERMLNLVGPKFTLPRASGGLFEPRVPMTTAANIATEGLAPQRRVEARTSYAVRNGALDKKAARAQAEQDELREAALAAGGAGANHHDGDGSNGDVGG